MAWTRATQVARGEGVVEGAVDGVLIVMQPITGEYSGLEGTAARIWQLLAEPTTFGELVDQLAVEYDVSRGECAPDVAQWLEQVRRQELVRADLTRT